MMNEPNCENCKWAIPQPLQLPNGEIVIGQTVHTCRRAPPTAVAIPISDANTGAVGVNLIAMFPPVDKTMFCSMHEFPPSEIDEIPPAHEFAD